MSVDRLAGVRLKFERTKKHVADLQNVIAAFFSTKPYKFGTKRDSVTGKLIYYITHIDPTPAEIPLIAADAFAGMISSLDHIVYQLFKAAGTTGRDRHLYFPIFDGEVEYKAPKSGRERKVKGLAPAAINAIDAMEPYKGGAGHAFWVIQELNNLAKHREVMTVGSMLRAADIGALMAEFMERNLGHALPEVHIFFKSADPLCPLKLGDELLGTPSNMEESKKLQFVFDVSLYEPQITDPQPLIETAHQFSNLVESAIVKLEPFM